MSVTFTALGYTQGTTCKSQTFTTTTLSNSINKIVCNTDQNTKLKSTLLQGLEYIWANILKSNQFQFLRTYVYGDTREDKSLIWSLLTDERDLHRLIWFALHFLVNVAKSRQSPIHYLSAHVICHVFAMTLMHPVKFSSHQWLRANRCVHILTALCPTPVQTPEVTCTAQKRLPPLCVSGNAVHTITNIAGMYVL